VGSRERLHLIPTMVFTEKHIINNAPDLVVESLEGLCALNPQLSLHAQHKVVNQKHQDRSKVALISGGGAGHEPAHAGFVGSGMLTAAVCGNVFASPNASQVKYAIDLLDNQKGTLIVVKNYTGDVLSFGLSREQYAAAHPDQKGKVKFLVVGDDVAVGRTQGSIVGRRGLAGTVLVYKVAGALAERGGPLDEVYGVAEYVANNIATIGCGLEHCHVPGTGRSESSIKENEIEIGLGIHNEPGFKTVSPVPNRKALIDQLLEMLTSTSDPERSFVDFKNDGQDEVVLMINNLGGLSELELGGIARDATAALTSRKINVQRLLVGAFMTSLNMPGFSLTLLRLPRSANEVPTSVKEILSLLDAKPETPGWKWASPNAPSITASVGSQFKTLKPQVSGIKHGGDAHKFEEIIQKACVSLVQAEPEITRLDSIAGDGDCGLTLKGGAEATLEAMKAGLINGDDILNSVLEISRIAEEKMGGTSGALYSIFFSALGQGLADATKASPGGAVTSQVWTQAASHALETLYGYTRARPPSRTLIDPLDAFVTSLKAGDGLGRAVERGSAATDQTAQIAAKAGRSAYIENKHLEGISDPGAVGVKLILQALLK